MLLNPVYFFSCVRTRYMTHLDDVVERVAQYRSADFLRFCCIVIPVQHFGVFLFVY